ncbi:MAG: hypothetical protein KF745_12850 [Phycisphaeraceae bacterium]|nr:hypothetical protein [Phycisphaeraceae bacterium]
MPTITLSDTTYAKLKAAAEPFVDTEDSVASRALDLLLERKGISLNGKHFGNGHAGASDKVVRLSVGTRDLTHTRLLSATVGGTEFHRPDWNSLLRDMHIMARKQLGSFEAVRKSSGANLKQGRFESDGYRYLPEADLSIQGCDSNHSCERAFNLAKAMNLPLSVSFEWRNKDEASHPGQSGLIEWQPEKK